MKTSAVYVVSLGCAKNLVDTEVMCGALLTNGFFIAEEPEDADIYLINTCGFIKDAKKESYEEIEAALEWKHEVPGRQVVAAGCLAQRYSKELEQKYPALDLIIGLDDFPTLPQLLTSRTERIHVREQLPAYLYTHEAPRITLTAPNFAYVKVAEGCDHRCAYCAIPHIRGNQRSRKIDDIVEECKQLLAQGTKEINFIAQDTSRYGVDLKTNLESLLRRCDELEGDFWLRVLYTHPLHLTEGLLELLANSKHVLPYLDIPLQHISTPVLQNMRRGMDGPKTKELLRNIRRHYPNMTIRTTFLVGFPGETDADFQELLDFVEEFKFDRLGVFTFSPEEGTPAADMKNNFIPHKIAEIRKEKILMAQAKIAREKNKAIVGTQLPVLLETQIAKNRWEGRSMADAPDVDQIVVVDTVSPRTPEDFGFVQAKILKVRDFGYTAAEIKETADTK